MATEINTVKTDTKSLADPTDPALELKNFGPEASMSLSHDMGILADPYLQRLGRAYFDPAGTSSFILHSRVPMFAVSYETSVPVNVTAPADGRFVIVSNPHNIASGAPLAEVFFVAEDGAITVLADVYPTQSRGFSPPTPGNFLQNIGISGLRTETKISSASDEASGTQAVSVVNLDPNVNPALYTQALLAANSTGGFVSSIMGRNENNGAVCLHPFVDYQPTATFSVAEGTGLVTTSQVPGPGIFFPPDSIAPGGAPIAPWFATKNTALPSGESTLLYAKRLPTGIVGVNVIIHGAFITDDPENPVAVDMDVRLTPVTTVSDTPVVLAPTLTGLYEVEQKVRFGSILAAIDEGGQRAESTFRLYLPWTSCLQPEFTISAEQETGETTVVNECVVSLEPVFATLTGNQTLMVTVAEGQSEGATSAIQVDCNFCGEPNAADTSLLRKTRVPVLDTATNELAAQLMSVAVHSYSLLDYTYLARKGWEQVVEGTFDQAFSFTGAFRSAVSRAKAIGRTAASIARRAAPVVRHVADAYQKARPALESARAVFGDSAMTPYIGDDAMTPYDSAYTAAETRVSAGGEPRRGLTFAPRWTGTTWAASLTLMDQMTQADKIDIISFVEGVKSMGLLDFLQSLVQAPASDAATTEVAAPLSVHAIGRASYPYLRQDGADGISTVYLSAVPASLAGGEVTYTKMGKHKSGGPRLFFDSALTTLPRLEVFSAVADIYGIDYPVYFTATRTRVNGASWQLAALMALTGNQSSEVFTGSIEAPLLHQSSNSCVVEVGPVLGKTRKTDVCGEKPLIGSFPDEQLIARFMPRSVSFKSHSFRSKLAPAPSPLAIQRSLPRIDATVDAAAPPPNLYNWADVPVGKGSYPEAPVTIRFEEADPAASGGFSFGESSFMPTPAPAQGIAPAPGSVFNPGTGLFTGIPPAGARNPFVDSSAPPRGPVPPASRPRFASAIPEMDFTQPEGAPAETAVQTKVLAPAILRVKDTQQSREMQKVFAGISYLKTKSMVQLPWGELATALAPQFEKMMAENNPGMDKKFRRVAALQLVNGILNAARTSFTQMEVSEKAKKTVFEAWRNVLESNKKAKYLASVLLPLMEVVERQYADRVTREKGPETKAVQDIATYGTEIARSIQSLSPNDQFKAAFAILQTGMFPTQLVPAARSFSWLTQ